MAETLRLAGNAPELKNGMRTSLSTLAGFVCAESPLADDLANMCGRPRSSFMVFPWGVPRRRVIVAFGFDSEISSAVRFSSEAAATIHLSALAVWCVQEIERLRGELSVVSGRLGGRKLVEKAKALLQAQAGLDEPQAYAYLRRLSRQRRTRMTKIARDLLEASESVQNVTL